MKSFIFEKILIPLYILLFKIKKKFMPLKNKGKDWFIY